ncbi:MAG: dTMP kinase [Alphaproteobacteria bacterium]
MEKKLFITFEGGEGSGKTTQINKLAQSLTDNKFRVLTTREPGGTEEAERIRELLVRRHGGSWTAMAECLLLFAARHMHVEKIIKPALERGKVVISDRFSDSTRAYQGYGHGFAMDEIENINTLVLGDFKPDLTFVLDIDPKEGIARSQHRLSADPDDMEAEDRYERMETEFHARVNKGFLELARKDKKRFVIIDASQSIDAMAAEILKTVLNRLA